MSIDAAGRPMSVPSVPDSRFSRPTNRERWMNYFFKPEDGWAADVIPYFWNGEYHLFYLKDYRDVQGHGLGTPWEHLGTRDFVSFTAYPQAIARGDSKAQDLWVFTGCVLEHRGRFHLFYTGHNRLFRDEERPQQAIMHAVSEDLVHWSKDERNPILFADPERYEAHDWRDPFVFWNEDAEEFWMLLAARQRGGPSRRRGCIALATSPDLIDWTVQDPFWAPSLYYTHECPDLFRIGEWWYLVFSEFSDSTVTRYRMSRDLRGPWLAPPVDTFDGRAFYAAKTVSDGVRRFACGWNPTRLGETDDGAWQWGGSLVTHEIVQAADGTLEVCVPPELVARFAHDPVALSEGKAIGTWGRQGSDLEAKSLDGFAARGLGRMPETCEIRVKMRCDAATQACGVLLRMDEHLENGYQVRWEPHRARLVIDRWPRPGDHPFQLERPLTVDADQATELRIFVDRSIVEIYANDAVAMSYRLYDRLVGDWGCFAIGGNVSFLNCSLTTPSR